MNKTKISILFALFLVQSVATAGEKEKIESAKIMTSIFEVCSRDGMLACEPQIQGFEEIFKYAELLNQISLLEEELKAFIANNYPESNGLDFDVIQASLALSLNVTFEPKNFTPRIVNAAEHDGGYDVAWDEGLTLKLREREGKWVAIFPPEANEKFVQLKPYILAAQLKQRILMYRLIEAEMADLTLDELEQNISEDLAPIVAALLGKENIPTLLKWIIKEPNEVIEFYSRLSTVEEMRSNIRKVHKL